jgi:hypothetical protein
MVPAAPELINDKLGGHKGRPQNELLLIVHR